MSNATTIEQRVTDSLWFLVLTSNASTLPLLVCVLQPVSNDLLLFFYPFFSNCPSGLTIKFLNFLSYEGNLKAAKLACCH